MVNDYRNTIYCPQYSNIDVKKRNLVKKIRLKHPRAKDMHAIIHPNNSDYKKDFMKIYNCKCAYCGVSNDVIPLSDFEIDHYIYEKSKKFKTKADAGYINNLVLACQDCNRDKSSFEFPNEKYDDFYPDKDEITKTFVRDNDYYIKISPSKNNDKIINDFYEKLHLGSEIHRIDYLLMNMIGLNDSISDKPEACSQLGKAIQKLHTKRNMMYRNK